MHEAPLLWSALIAYVVAGSTAIVALALERRAERGILALLGLGLALHGAALAARWASVGHGPFITLFEILSSNVWSLTLVFTLAYWRVPAVRPAAAFVMPVLFILMGWLLVAHPGEGHFPPTYRTLWLYVHVGLGKVFLGAVLVAVGLSGLILARLAAQGLEELAFRFMAIGFVFETLMLLSGAVWAQDAWGRYWAWDPLETWAFLTWLSLAAFLHARVAFRVGPRASAVMIIGVFVLAFLTFFGVPFISTAPHKGAI
ncbi:MAG TPA: cytochrome c biogenesis protein CcsA [Burkholderiales bacterium]|nr:cytochrome c biogenesis protein CcsA [Burkholderiales bacterium]